MMHGPINLRLKNVSYLCMMALFFWDVKPHYWVIGAHYCETDGILIFRGLMCALSSLDVFFTVCLKACLRSCLVSFYKHDHFYSFHFAHTAIRLKNLTYAGVSLCMCFVVHALVSVL